MRIIWVGGKDGGDTKPAIRNRRFQTGDAIAGFTVVERMTPRAAYIHVPFCAHHCGYCNFTVVAGRDELAGEYLGAIERELSWLGEPREVDTLYVGGGTPTHLEPEMLGRLLESVLAWHPLAAGAEFTVEANPADLTVEKMAVLAGHGATRVSLGAQSFDAQKLKVLERDHRSGDIARACERVRSAGAAVALDLIFAVPGETADVWSADLDAAIALAPEHVSTYGLTFERGTAFWGRLQKGDLVQADEELERSMYMLAIDTLSAAGFEHYEVSNFAQPGERSRHNEVYWSGEPYYAAGPGAARYVDGTRETNHRSTTTYLQRVLAGQSPVAESETLEPEDVAREALVFGLRRLEGVDRTGFVARTGFEIETLVGEELQRYVELGLLVDEDNRVRLSREGLLVSDSIWPDFLRV